MRYYYLIKKFINDITRLTEKLIRFRNKRERRKYHTPSNSALGVVLEAAELASHLQWKNKRDLEKYLKTHKTEVADEIFDFTSTGRLPQKRNIKNNRQNFSI